MKLKQSELNLLIILGVVLVVFCSYFFGFRNLMAKNDIVTDEVAKLEEKYKNLKNMKQKIDDFKNDTVDYNSEIDKMYSSFDKGASQEYTIKFLEAIEDNVPTAWIRSASLSQPEQIFTFGNVTSSNPTMMGQVVYQSSNVGYAMKSTISFEANYADFKEMLKYLLDNPSKCTVESLSVSYSA